MLSPTGHSAPTPAQPASSGGVPAALARLPAGSLISGTVTGRDSAGQLLVRTDDGTLPLATRLDLARGATVTLRVGDGPIFATIIETVDGRPVETVPRLPAIGTPPQASTAPPPSDASSRSINTLLTAVVIATLPDVDSARPGLPPANAAALPAPVVGSRVAFQIIAIGAAAPQTGTPQPTPLTTAATPSATAATPTTTPSLPVPSAGSHALSVSPGTSTTPAGAPAASSLVATTAGSAGSGLPAPAAASPGPVAALPVGATPTLVATTSPALSTNAPSAIVGSPTGPTTAALAGPSARPAAVGVAAATNPVQAPPAAIPSPLTGASPQTPPGGQGHLVAATVTGIDGAGRPILGTALGALQLETRAPLPVNTTLTLKVADAAPLTAAPVPGAPLEALAGLTHNWPALREAIAVLHQVNPALADRVIQSAVASPGANLAQGVLFFLAALRGGDLSGWLGRGVVRALEDSGRGDLVRRLVSEFGQIARLADQPSSGEWQPLLVPLHDGDQLRQMRLYIRRHLGKGDDEDGGTRFVVDVEMSRLGELQLDGLLHERRFDLILRSHDRMADGTRADIAAIFSDGLATAGLIGTLSFQVAATFPVAPLDEIFAGDHDGVLV